MDETQFAERIAKIRARFVSKLADKIHETDASLPVLTGNGNDTVEAVTAAYRRFHEMIGIGSTIGFEATGQAARAIDAILIGPFRDHRGLSADELAKLKDGIASLRTAAQADTQSSNADRS